MEIFVSAGEASSDIHCAHLIRELKTHAPVDTFGLGGDRLVEQGMRLMMHNREFSVGGGPLEILSKLPKRAQLERLLEKRLFESRPDGAILVDNGEINLRLAAMLHFFDVPVIYFIPPKVWAWRMSRIEKIAEHVDLVLSILPFEEPLYKEWEVPFKYVGNPLIDEVPADLSAAGAKKLLGIDLDTDVLTVLPGSRFTEIRHHCALFAEAIVKFSDSLGDDVRKPVVVIPAAQAIEPNALEAAFQEHLRPAGIELRVVKGQSHAALKAARAALVKSGTSTLEAALLEIPMILAYRSSRSSEWLFKHLVRYRGFIGLVNLFLSDNPMKALGWDTPEDPIVPEVVLGKCTPENIATELRRVYLDGPDREKMALALSRTRRRLMPPPGQGDSPLKAAALAAWDVFNGA